MYPPTPGCFWAKSAKSFEKKAVEFSQSAKKCKRVRNSVRTKNNVEMRHAVVTTDGDKIGLTPEIVFWWKASDTTMNGHTRE